ncbi:hypothetical protein HN958_00075 [Candidatus Falkowbacteria bacterium]|jgi:hypothetical protein|nr:hypothetical protein [Candidatus Falkowbacteria bacterium]MBT7006884.1 hypothetical protein [Candidatus Falkowbacteria bacterium]
MFSFSSDEAVVELSNADSARELFFEDRTFEAAKGRYDALKESLHSASALDPVDQAANEALQKLERFFPEIEAEFIECR